MAPGKRADKKGNNGKKNFADSSDRSSSTDTNPVTDNIVSNTRQTTAGNPGEIIREISKIFEQGIDFNVIGLELGDKQKDDLLSIANFMKKQQKLKADAEIEILTEEDHKLLQQAETALEKYLSLIKEIKNIS